MMIPKLSLKFQIQLPNNLFYYFNFSLWFLSLLKRFLIRFYSTVWRNLITSATPCHLQPLLLRLLIQSRLLHDLTSQIVKTNLKKNRGDFLTRKADCRKLCEQFTKNNFLNLSLYLFFFLTIKFALLLVLLSRNWKIVGFFIILYCSC